MAKIEASDGKVMVSCSISGRGQLVVRGAADGGGDLTIIHPGVTELSAAEFDRVKKDPAGKSVNKV